MAERASSPATRARLVESVASVVRPPLVEFQVVDVDCGVLPGRRYAWSFLVMVLNLVQ